MSILTIKDSRRNDTEINLQNITQLQGENIEKKEYIVSSIIKHFSRHKYCDNEELQYNNILINNEEIGRNYFTLSYISNIADIEHELTANKNTLIINYMNNLISNISISSNIISLNDELQRIVNDFNDCIDIKSLNCRLKTIEMDIDKLLKSNLEIEIQGDSSSYLEYISNYDKISLYIELLCKVNQRQPDKQLILFNNIDNLINENQYCSLLYNVKTVCKNNDFYFVFICSKKNYVSIDEELISGINVINDVVFNVSSLELIKSYVESHYPYNKKFQVNELINYIKPIINNIGKRSEPVSLQSQIILNLLNTDLNIVEGKIEPINKIEIEYMIKQ